MTAENNTLMTTPLSGFERCFPGETSFFYRIINLVETLEISLHSIINVVLEITGIEKLLDHELTDPFKPYTRLHKDITIKPKKITYKD